MEPVDWNQEIELMDGTPKVHLPEATRCGYWILDPVRGGHTFLVDIQGCIGGVQVVRNRKPVKRARYLYIAADGEVSLFPDNEQMDNCARLNIWRDEDGKTRVEVRDD